MMMIIMIIIMIIIINYIIRTSRESSIDYSGVHTYLICYYLCTSMYVGRV